MQVRPGRPDDADVLTRHAIGVATETEDRSPDPVLVRKAVTAALADPAKARYFVAERDGSILGSLFVTYEWSDWTAGWYWWIQGVYVEPEARRHGVFQALYDAVHAAAQQEGDVREVRLYVDAGNEAGLATYRAVGMEETPYRVFRASIH